MRTNGLHRSRVVLGETSSCSCEESSGTDAAEPRRWDGSTLRRQKEPVRAPPSTVACVGIEVGTNASW